MKKLLFAFLVLAGSVLGQSAAASRFVRYNAAPATCQPSAVFFNLADGLYYNCPGGVPTPWTGGGGGVASVVIQGTANKISVSGTCTIVTTGTCTITIPDGVVLVTPNLGTPTVVTLTNGTGLPISTGVSGLGTGVAAALGTAVSGSGAICLASGSACSGGGSSITIGTTTITSGTTTRVLFDNAGVVGEYTITGSGNVAMSTSPTFVTPVLGTPTSVTLTNGTGLPISTGVSGLGTGVGAALGVAVSGSGAICLASGSACTGGGSNITIGTTTITSGTNTRVLFNNAGVAGEYAITGSGNVVMSTSATLVTPDLGTPSVVTLTNATGLPASGISSGTIATARLGSGTASSSTFLRGDQTWATPAGSGDVVGPASAADTAVALYNGTTGKSIKNSGVTVDGSNNISTPGGVSTGVGGTDAGRIDMTAQTNIIAVPANSFGFGVPTVMNTSVRLQSPNAVPAANQVMVFGAPTANISTWAWTNVSALAVAFSSLTGTAAVVQTGQTNTYTTGAQDLSAATSMKVPVSAGAAPTANGAVAYDSTANALEYGDNGTNRTIVNLDEAQTLTSKTLTQPTIGDFTNSTHNHSNAAGGGTVAFSALTGTSTVVQTGQTNTYTTGAQDFTSATSLTTPVSAGCAPTANGTLCFDSTANDLEYGDNGTNRKFANLDEAQTFSGVKTFSVAPVISTITNTGTVTLFTATDTVVGKATTDTFTNKTYNVESTGNVLTTLSPVWIDGASCSGTTGTLNWDTLATEAPTPICSAGTTNTALMRATADFLDAAQAQMQRHMKLPADFTGTVDVVIKWRSTATSGNVFWQVATVCIADAEVDDAAWNTASTVADAAKGTANQENDASITGVTITGCAAGEDFHTRLLRDPANGSDTLSATASLVGVEYTFRRAQ